MVQVPVSVVLEEGEELVAEVDFGYFLSLLVFSFDLQFCLILMSIDFTDRQHWRLRVCLDQTVPSIDEYACMQVLVAWVLHKGQFQPDIIATLI